MHGLSTRKKETEKCIRLKLLSCMKGTFLHIRNMLMKQLCYGRVRDLAMALRARKVPGAFEKRAPGR